MTLHYDMDDICYKDDIEPCEIEVARAYEDIKFQDGRIMCFKDDIQKIDDVTRPMMQGKAVFFTAVEI